ncbi:transporter substrate-binding domain-containing protein [Geobacter pelophilus]|uniref:Transporter substrate-binding domain-containing protein n=1 Tax=Geoanaerobacter pelophilus TaxID=60036 RepID=A0AAW4L5B0_9BACT|nr:transporter substrate-binding domain-containing protein [Geoanaerobacter pelophilus]MBT0664715.1 transporter substrate-binding domain-containing protein [Geoanaerobacter pelophilus]
MKQPSIIQKLFLIMTILTCLPLQHAHASSLPSGCEELVFSANPQYPPYHWAVGRDGFEGASIELLAMVMPKQIRLKPVVYPWKRVLLLAEQGEIDLVVSLRDIPDRERYLVFTKHRAFANPSAVFVRADSGIRVNEWRDLKKRKGAISLGDTFGLAFDSYWRKELTITESGTMVENFRLLDQGIIDYFITGKYPGTYYISQNRTTNKITPLELQGANDDIYFGFSKKSPCVPLVESVSKRLEELDKKGISEKLLRKYLKNVRKP